MREKLKAIMLDIIEEAEAIEEMAPQDLKKYLMENHENFDPEEFDEIGNAYVFKCGILAGKLAILKSCIEEM